MARLGFLLVCSLTCMLSEVKAARPPVSSFFDFEVETNETIDEILARENQDVRGSSSYGDEDGVILAELDMLVTPKQYRLLYGEESSGKGVKRKAHIANRPWTNAQLVYTINHEFCETDRYHIRQAMRDIEARTCVTFRERTSSDRNYVYIQNGNGCNSFLGMLGGRQELNLRSPGCRYMGLYYHEILHTLGVVHEHQRPDRDNYLNIYRQNVQPRFLYSLKKYSTRAVNTMNVEYDFSSVMHYGTKAFSRNGQHTLYPKDPNNYKLITPIYKNVLRHSDVKILNLMYKCASHCPNQNKCNRNGYLDRNCNCVCKDGSQDCVTTEKPDPDKHRCSNICSKGRYLDQNCNCICKDGSQDCGTTTTPEPDDPDCKNIHNDDWQCYAWATKGECVNNQAWMLPNCAKACGNCNNIVCRNKHSNESACYQWAATGACRKNPAWMLPNCAKACGLCKKTEPCRNIHSDELACHKWAAKGECRNNPAWMLPYCAKACGLCKTTDTCNNKHYDEWTCYQWASKGECANNPTWMLPNCARACGNCKNTQNCGNKHSDQKACYKWAWEGECISNPKWMLPNCARACGKCENIRASSPSGDSV